MTDSTTLSPAPSPALTPAAPPTDAAARKPETPAEAEFSFWDLLDIVNPLQHIPVIGHLYREVTGDEIRAPARILGGTLFGGPLGMAASVVGAIVEETSGKSPVKHMMAWITGDPGDRAPAATAVAQAEEPPAPVTVAQAVMPPKAAQSAEARSFPLPPREGAAEARFYPLPGRLTAPRPAAEASSPAAAPAAPAPVSAALPGGPAPVPRELIADAMLNALDKYQRAAGLRASGGR